MASILFSTPCYAGNLTVQYFKSCMTLTSDLVFDRIDHEWNIGTNDSLITRIRNEMAKDFLDSRHSHLFWIDSDIEFTTQDVIKVWNLEADIGVGIYSMKLPEKPLSAWKDGKLVKLDECPNEPFEVDYAGTGFMQIRREVLETMANHSESYEGNGGRRVPALFMTPVHNDGLESEDYNFCRRARELGFKIIADPSIKLGHIGQYRYGHS